MSPVPLPKYFSSFNSSRIYRTGFSNVFILGLYCTTTSFWMHCDFTPCLFACCFNDLTDSLIQVICNDNLLLVLVRANNFPALLSFLKGREVRWEQLVVFHQVSGLSPSPSYQQML